MVPGVCRPLTEVGRIRIQNRRCGGDPGVQATAGQPLDVGESAATGKLPGVTPTRLGGVHPSVQAHPGPFMMPVTRHDSPGRSR